MTVRSERKCRRCSSVLDTAGARGLCLACLSISTSHKFSSGDAQNAVEELRLEEGLSVGPQDRFLLHDKLGSGGMGEVWLATDLELSREDEPYWVALKFLGENIRANKQAIAAVRTEVIRSQELNHPNIVRVFDLHTTVKGMPFIKMEYVKGHSLAYWLEDCPGGVMHWKEVCEIARQLCSALQYAHETAGVIHRDIKPGNLLLRNDRILKVADFGIAEALYGARAASIKEKGIGTAWYASPQQLLGQRPTPADDIHAVGATLYELLTGEPPFLGDTSDHTRGDTSDALIHQVRYDLAEPIQQRLARRNLHVEVPPNLATLVQRCLEKDIMARPMAREILALLPAPTNTPVAPAPARSSEPERPPKRKTPVVPPVPVEQWEPEIVETVKPSLLSRLVTVGAYALVLGLAAWISMIVIQARAKKKVDVSEALAQPTNSNPVEVDSGGTQIAASTPEPAIQSGRLHVILDGILTTRKRDRSLTIHNSDGEIAASFVVQPHQSRLTDIHLKPGRYRVTLAEELDERKKDVWTVSASTNILSDQIARVFLTAELVYIKVDSNIKNARISWAQNLNPDRDAFAAPGKEVLLPTGTFPIYAHAVKHVMDPLIQTATVVDKNSRIFVSMRESRLPTPSLDWNNTLEMPMLAMDRLGPAWQGVWVSQYETRIRDFKVFGATNKIPSGLYALTTNGIQYIEDLSWENLPAGFTRLDEQHPVVGVNWQDATAFCKWLTVKERASGDIQPNQSYALPTTEEWITLAGGEEFPWGKDEFRVRDGRGNYSANEVRNTANWPASWPHLTTHADQFPRTAPPAPQFANALGLIHMGGNAAEWTRDQHVIGASWMDGEDLDIPWLRTRNFQTKIPPDQRHDRIGFRILLRTEQKL